MSVSHWIAERNRDVADAIFGSDTERRTGSEYDADERKAAGLTPFIVTAAAAAAFGGAVGLDKKQRTASAAVAAILFLAL